MTQFYNMPSDRDEWYNYLPPRCDNEDINQETYTQEDEEFFRTTREKLPMYDWGLEGNYADDDRSL